jgi:Cu+-exporting ATPase
MATVQTVHDVVCGMDIDPTQAAGTSEYQGRTYYFCSTGCKRQFDKDPERFVAAGHAHDEHQQHESDE